MTKPRGIIDHFLIKPRGIITHFLTKPRGIIKTLLLELAQNILELLRNHRHYLIDYRLRNILVKRLRDAAGDAHERVGVAAKRNSKPYRALEIVTFQKSYNSLGNSALTRAIKTIC